jgi:hypothetical protein
MWARPRCLVDQSRTGLIGSIAVALDVLDILQPQGADHPK